MKGHDARTERGADDASERPEAAGTPPLARLHATAGNAAVAARLDAAGAPPLAVQRMFGVNVPCCLTTSKGSTYTVALDGLTRKAYYDKEPHSGPKNVFYCDKATSDALLAASRATHDYRVQPRGLGTVLLTFHFADRVPESYVLQAWPAVGLYPVDMVLRDDGRPEADDRFHVGHAITKVT